MDATPRQLLATATLAGAILTSFVAPAYGTPDLTTRIDANRIDMLVTNIGDFAYEAVRGDAGLTYPKGTDFRATFAAGLFIGGRVGGATRATVAHYATEYVPGPIVGGEPAPDGPSFRVFKLDCRSGPGDPDYDAWPRELGAPVDPSGAPLMLGDQTLWCVFNDAEPDSHTVSAGSTPPLGVEVQLSAYAFDQPGALANTVFMRYVIHHRGADQVDSTYVSLWSDPDIGAPHSVRHACDPELDLGYGYKTNDVEDPYYGSQTPAVGYRLLSTPADAGMTSYVGYTNGIDPGTAAESYAYQRGLQRDGTPQIDPTTNMPSPHWYSGDPVSSTGWLVDFASNKKMMVSTGPFNFAPGDSLEIVAALIMAQGHDNLDSVRLLRQYAAEIEFLYRTDALPRRVEVWPGDLDGNGVVDADDLLPLVVFWRAQGHACDAGLAWEPRHVFEWAEPAATAADANGDGAVDMADLLAIGINWAQTHPVGRDAPLFDASAIDLTLHREALLEILAGVRALSHPGREAMLERLGAWLEEATPAVAPMLHAAYPNPFRQSASIIYEIGEPGHVALTIYDVNGRRVRGLVDAWHAAGPYEVRWDGANDRARPVPSGVYVYELRASGGVRSGELLRIR